MSKFNLNNNITIYPSTKGWSELSRLTKDFYNLTDEKTLDWINQRKTNNGDMYGFKDQLHVIMNIYGSMFFNGQDYLLTANVELNG
jgi:hypothetical protein